jgi:hypothetical protein
MTKKEILEKAIQKAIECGWDFDGLLAPMDPGKYEVIAPFGGNYLRIKTTSWSGEESFESINSVIYSKNFAKALWGEEIISSEDGLHFGVIRLWAEQVAYEFEGRIHSLDGRSHMSFVRYNDDNLINRAPTGLVEVEKVTLNLKDIVARIPFHTHKIKEIETEGGIPKWQYHLRQMVIAENPIKYLGENI